MRKYPKYFVSKLTISNGESAKTQVWLDYALACNYIDEKEHDLLYDKYEHIMAMLTNMITHPDQWKF